MKIFGKATEFYRIRLQEMSEEVGLDMDWNDNILYRRPIPFKGKTTTYYIVQAVIIDTNRAINLKRFMNKQEAARWLAQAAEEITNLTKKQFEDKFIK